MGFGQTSLSGVHRGFMPPQLKTKTVRSVNEVLGGSESWVNNLKTFDAYRSGISSRETLGLPAGA